MNGKHTPGPWRIWRDMDPKEPAQIVDPNIDGICVIDGLNTNAAANMALISAAPDMLEALRSAVRFLDTPRNSSDEAELVEVMQAAIRKATGEQ